MNLVVSIIEVIIQIHAKAPKTYDYNRLFEILNERYNHIINSSRHHFFCPHNLHQKPLTLLLYYILYFKMQSTFTLYFEKTFQNPIFPKFSQCSQNSILIIGQM